MYKKKSKISYLLVYVHMLIFASMYADFCRALKLYLREKIIEIVCRYNIVVEKIQIIWNNQINKKKLIRQFETNTYR